MKKKWSLVTVGLVAVSLCAATVYGQHRFGGMGWKGRKGMMGDGPGMMGDGPGMMLPLLLRGADLTPEQKTQVQKIMANNRDEFHTLFNQVRAAQKDLVDQLFASKAVTVDKLAPQVQLVTQLRGQLLQKGLKTALEVRGVLTPEQLAKAAQRKDRLQALHAEMRSLLEEKE